MFNNDEAGMLYSIDANREALEMVETINKATRAITTAFTPRQDSKVLRMGWIALSLCSMLLMPNQ